MQRWVGLILGIRFKSLIQATLESYVRVSVSIRVVTMSKGMGQGRENSGIHVMWNGAYCSRSIIPILNSVPLHLCHVVRLDADSTNGSIDNLLPSRTHIQVLVFGLERI